MKASYEINKLNVEFEGETIKDIWRQLAIFQEIFGENACGKCESDSLRFVVRENDGNHFYELRCEDCGARLSYGSHKKGGGLFPKRKDGDGNWLPDKGWMKWNPKTKSLE